MARRSDSVLVFLFFFFFFLLLLFGHILADERCPIEYKITVTIIDKLR
jgi:hypothetical protein